MATTIHKLNDEPIIVVTHHGFLTAQDSYEFTVSAADIAAASPEPLIWIIDLRDSQTDFGQIMKMLAHESTGQRGTAASAPGRVILVGTDSLIRLFQNAMRQPQFGGLEIPTVPLPEDAMAVARLRVRQMGLSEVHEKGA